MKKAAIPFTAHGSCCQSARFINFLPSIGHLARINGKGIFIDLFTLKNYIIRRFQHRRQLGSHILIRYILYFLNELQKLAKCRVGHTFFSKECSVLSVLYKRMFRSFRSFPFFIKEHSVLSVLFCSL